VKRLGLAAFALATSANAQDLPTEGVVVFESNKPLEAVQIMRLDLQTGELLVEAAGESPFAANDEVVFISRCGEFSLDAAISIADSDGFTSTLPDVCDPDATGGRLNTPVISPDGQVIAVNDPVIPDKDALLSVIGTDGIRVFARSGKQLAEHQGFAYPLFNASGTLYAAGTGEVEGIPHGIYRFDADFGDPVRIDDGCLNGPVWSMRLHPDGDKIGFVFNGAIFRMPLETGVPERIVRSGVPIAWMDFAPDGSGGIRLNRSAGRGDCGQARRIPAALRQRRRRCDVSPAVHPRRAGELDQVAIAIAASRSDGARMFQTFDATTTPDQGPPRIALLRAKMAEHGVDAFIVPRADAHQGEYVAPRDDRLAWLTGFTGSAGFAAILADKAGIFIDGRYTLQVRDQVDTSVLTPVDWPKTKLGPWLKERLPEGTIGIDPWLHTTEQVEALEKAGVTIAYLPNLVDAVWEDQPDAPVGKVEVYPTELAGKSHEDKRKQIGVSLGAAKAAVITLPDSISWLLNVRGSDLPHTPSVQAFAILASDGGVRVFTAPEKLAPLADHLGDDVTVHPPSAFATTLAELDGPVRVDRASAPFAVVQILQDAGVEIAWGTDPCSLPKATKTPAEIAATTEAHLRDGAAMAEFLAWLDQAAPQGGLTEIDVVKKLEGCRRATNALRDISFDTISGAGPNGAIVHYRVTRETNRQIAPGDLLLVDSGGQYVDGTTDITRTVTTGTPTPDQIAAFTNVLKGVIAISRARWPKGLTGRDLDPLARAALWRAGQDYDHGTGHGVGVFLSVHEGPQRLSRASDVALRPGMILSNEPGYYREGEWGIRIENLVVVEDAPKIAGGDDGREQLCFNTLTYAPIDTRLADSARLSPGERDWLNAYHAEVEARIASRVGTDTQSWLRQACHAI